MTENQTFLMNKVKEIYETKDPVDLARRLQSRQWILINVSIGEKEGKEYALFALGRIA